VAPPSPAEPAEAHSPTPKAPADTLSAFPSSVAEVLLLRRTGIHGQSPWLSAKAGKTQEPMQTSNGGLAAVVNKEKLVQKEIYDFRLTIYDLRFVIPTSAGTSFRLTMVWLFRRILS